ncbi:MAS20-domain-containing protein [Dacryopinax primogenitus]|uniref:Mitochondrial import receptor subunit TOM20 n=1 Tax=Dacryopinax primogenitus (strain DJM 731) TaxID=1858805 RepID=M5GGV2_DACPD|nr:MAS20-domain-containing protein [Dacryopinax primogenitus]EJU06133.1 MAS20-domain-containing protein [Dacryopinax primogenitus]
MVNKTIQYTTVAFISCVAISGLAYVGWWDYKRRNDPSFRKKLRKEHKKANKHAKAADEQAKKQRTADLKEALEKIKVETVPTTPEEREQYFMQHVGIGEQLSVQGPAFHVAAALSFYRALRVYPSPVELIMIYQKTVPEPVFKIVMDLTSLDVSNTVAPADLGVDDDAPTSTPPATGSGSPSSAGTRHGGRRGASASGASGDERSEASSQDWETVTDPESHGHAAAPSQA